MWQGEEFGNGWQVCQNSTKKAVVGKGKTVKNTVLPKYGKAVKIFYAVMLRMLANFHKLWYNTDRKGKELLMQKFLTDVHTHSKYSMDGKSELSEMLQSALEKGIAFYGVSEHFDYDAYLFRGDPVGTDAEEYFHGARHLQEDYEGCMNVLIGAEMGYCEDERVQSFYQGIQEKYHPDFVVNSVHALHGIDYYHLSPFYMINATGEKILREKKEVYREYLKLVRESLDVPYSYDIVGHFGYVTRYAPYEDKEMKYADYAEEIDDILTTIIQKGKILELNTSRSNGIFLPSKEWLERYYALGGRNVSYGSDAHMATSVANGRDKAVEMLKEIGFTHITVPCKGEYVKVEL